MGPRRPDQDRDGPAAARQPLATQPPVAPSGEQYEIAHGEQRVVVVEVGGGLRQYRDGDLEVLDGYAADEICDGARGQPLVPWPNRLRDGRYRFAGSEHQVPLSEPARHNAIHGLLRWRSWTAVEHSAAAVTVENVLHPQPGYPFTLRTRIAYRLGDEGLRVTIRGRNEGSQPLPFGAGQHPYLRPGRGVLDDATLLSPARTRLLTDDRGIPTGERVPVGDDDDFRVPRRIGRVRLDAAFTDLGRGPDGCARVVLRGGGRQLTLWMDGRFRHLMLFTGDTLEPGRRRQGLAVEPMTCPPNALQTGEDVAVLGPGEELTANWGITVTPVT